MGEEQQPAVPPNLTKGRSCEPPLKENPWLIGAERWKKAEKAAEQIISKFRPTTVAERKRVEIIVYLQRLLMDNLDCEVFAYGSVPLKTYLPDGDIDLTVVGASKDDLVEDIASLLKREGKNSSAKFVVKDVQLIRAEVKLVKCFVHNIVVDISINQIGGLCTLCFLEQVDRVIGKDHIFKQSIILIKAWCYYESRTLGAHAGLISTYGLEVLVVYIFHVFHRTLDGPLSVLYKFLEYFSTFDWDNYCISLLGPVRISALLEIVAERPPNSDDLLLGGDFLRHCFQTLSVPMRDGDGFPKRHLNIIDPLKDNNNLGRCVSKANFMRIRSAFTYGARQLGQILTVPEDIDDGLRKYFSNTLSMHGSGRRPDLQDPSLMPSLNISAAEVSRTTSCQEEKAESRGEKIFTRTETRQQKSSNDENSIGFSVNQSSGEGKEVSNLRLQDLNISEPLDLTGNLNAHLACLDNVRRWYAYIFGLPAMAGPPPPPPLLLTMSALEHAHHVARFERNGGMNSIVPLPGFYPPNQMLMPRPPFGPEEPNPRGTVTYLPHMNRPPLGFHVLPMDGMLTYADVSDTPRRILSPSASGFISPPDFAPVRPPRPFREPSLHRRRHHNRRRSPPAETMRRPRPVSGMHRFKVQSPYHLKDEDDFPPLSI